MILIFRHPQFQADVDALRHVASLLADQTRYRWVVPDTAAPAYTNCITAIRYLFKKATSLTLPNTWMGGMPRGLFNKGWKMVRIHVSALRMGDLILLRRKNHNAPQPEQYYISHIQLALSSQEVFHSTWSDKIGPMHIKKGAKIERFHDISKVIDEPSLFLRYVDPRNWELRALINGKNPEKIRPLVKEKRLNVRRDIGSNQWISYAVYRSPDGGVLFPRSIWQLIWEYARKRR